MPNPFLKIAMLSASLGLSACSGSGQGNEAGQYNPPAKITASPEPFRSSEAVTFTASVYAPNSAAGTGDNPDKLFLQLVPVAADGTRDLSNLRKEDEPYPGADGSGWATVTFKPVNPPAAPPGGTLEVNVSHKIWKGKKLDYVPIDSGPADLRTAYFRMDCGAKSGEPVAAREGSSVCIYKRQ